MDEILAEAFQLNFPVYILLVIAAFFTAFYMGRQVWLVFFGDPRHPAAEHAEKAKIYVAIEPLNRFETYFLNTAEDAVKLVKAVDHENLKVQIDTFHSNIEEKDTAAAIRATGEFLGHFHASESDRGVPGTGQVKWKECFSALREIGYGGWVTIETFAMGIVDLNKAACIWRPLYDSADDLAVKGLAFLKGMVSVA